MRVPRNLLRHSLLVEDYAGAGALGPAYQAVRGVNGLFQPSRRLTPGPEGRELLVDASVVIRPEDAPVPVESRVTVAGEVYRVVQAVPMPDTRRPTHWELMLARLTTGTAGAGSGS